MGYIFRTELAVKNKGALINFWDETFWRKNKNLVGLVRFYQNSCN